MDEITVLLADDHVLLLQGTRELLERERRVGEIAEGITSKIGLDKVLSRVVQIAEKLVDAVAGVIALPDETKGVVRCPHIHNLPQELIQVNVPVGQGLAGQGSRTGILPSRL